MKSLGDMIRRLGGLIDTQDVTPWENKFLDSIWAQTNGGLRTTHLTEKQIDAIERLFQKHYGDQT